MVGLCVSDAGLAVARLRAQDGEPTLDLLDYQPAERPQRRETLAQLVKRHGLSGHDCVCVLTGLDYQLNLVETPEVPAAELRSALRWRLKEYLDYRIEDAVVDGFEQPQSGRGGRALTFAVSARAALVAELAALVDSAGLVLNAVDIPELALRNIAAEVPDQGGGVMLVVLNPNSGLITISQDDVLYLSRNVEFGFNQIGGNAAHFCDLLGLEIQRSLDFYDSQLAGRPVSRILLAPMPQGRDAVLDHLSNQLGVATFGLDLGQILSVAGVLDDEAQARGIYAVGGALRREQAGT